MGICLIVGGSKCLPGWFGALMQWKLKFKWVFACVKEGVKACQDALGHLSPSKRWFDKVAQIGPKIKCPRVPGWVRGGGVQSQFGQCPNRRLDILIGASLSEMCLLVNLKPSCFTLDLTGALFVFVDWWLVDPPTQHTTTKDIEMLLQIQQASFEFSQFNATFSPQSLQITTTWSIQLRASHAVHVTHTTNKQTMQLKFPDIVTM